MSDEGFTLAGMHEVFWINNPEARRERHGWGSCHGTGGKGMCSFGYIGCPIDHATVKIVNMLEDIKRGDDNA